MTESPQRGHSAAELLQQEAAAFRSRRRTFDKGLIADTAWNGWRLSPDSLVLFLYDNDGHYAYELELLRLTDSAHILDWVLMVNKKGLQAIDTAKVTLGFIRMIDDILNLQSNVCGSGANKQLTAQQIRDLAAAYVHRFNTA
ncbi:hypothetical protein ACFFMN_29410 [Planobispora siamensis]|uniref:Uncharacterized protein n=1 Tax=Planobispora siamensis TaxID=936338 RepID=A0A8J3SEN8_9ACTN|nr:hypothetical protein [Planobispora siamensis]GIH91695.1 hypothetical protein Psi01_23250 [Planobispora siamensis]